MRIVILDPYFESLGGGEKVLAVMAEHLALKNEVIVLVKQTVDKKAVDSYFDVELDKVKFSLIPKENIFVRIITSSHIKLPGRWKSIIYDRNSLKMLKKLNADIFINNLYQSNLPSRASKSIYMCMFPQKLKPSADHYSPARKLYNEFTDVLEAIFLGSRKKVIDSYSIVTANSKYTAGWIKKYWGRESKILYPVCDNMGPPAVKKNTILSIGRFFADNGSSHHKRHDELIKAFIRLNRPDWELHVVGSLATDKDSAIYFSALQELAKNHQNIFIHPDLPFNELKRLSREATIYWHATGYGYDEDIFPANQEHFGMATSEAMSAGAVPVVYNSAGQAEVVSDGQNGFLWTTIDELLVKTNKVIEDKALREKLALAAMQRAHEFDRQAFVKRVDAILSTLN